MHFPYDDHFMRSAIALARTGLGRTGSNPSVGCVLVKEGVVIARARTADNGRPHAETRALDMAGEKAQGATAYVTLEPCSHHGQTGPCAEALIRAGIKRCVIALGDPNPDVNGGGIAMLKEAGIDVELGACADEAYSGLKGFFLGMEEGRPEITLKLALSKNNMIAGAQGQPIKITNEITDRYVHILRAQHDGILVGINTALNDDPSLTTRLAGVEHKPTRIVLDSGLKINEESVLVQTARDVPVVIVSTAADGAKKERLRAKGVEVMETSPHDLTAVMAALHARGIQRLLVEGGATIHDAFMRAQLADQFVIIQGDADIESGINGFINTDWQDNYNLEHIKDFFLAKQRVLIYENKHARRQKKKKEL